MQVSAVETPVGQLAAVAKVVVVVKAAVVVAIHPLTRHKTMPPGAVAAVPSNPYLSLAIIPISLTL